MSQETILLRSRENKYNGLVQGSGLTLVLAVLAQQLTDFPFLSIMGTMVIAILLGIAWRIVMEIPVAATRGINFAAKSLLKLGVALMGIRLNINELLVYGPKIILLDVLVITFTITFFWWMGRRLSLTGRLTSLIGVGTAVCGASAIAAVAPLIGADDDETALSVAIIAILGTFQTLIYIVLYPQLQLSPYVYGVLTGATLHEVGHVVAAAMVGGKVSAETAIIVKLGRVALLIPVALIISYLYNRKQRGEGNKSVRKMPIPWFVFGFLGFSLLNSFNLLLPSVEHFILQVSIFLLTMAMAGLGLNVEPQLFQRIGGRYLLMGAIGSLALALLGMALMALF